MNNYIKKQVDNIMEMKKSANEELFREWLMLVLSNTWSAGEIAGIKETKELSKYERSIKRS